MQDDRYGKTREELLYEDYLEGAEGGGPGQAFHGFRVSFAPNKDSQHRIESTLATCTPHSILELLQPVCTAGFAPQSRVSGSQISPEAAVLPL